VTDDGPQEQWEEGFMNVLKWVGLLLFAQSFEYGHTGFGPSFSIGVTVTPDRLVFIIILVLCVFRLIRGEWQYIPLGKVGWYTLLFALICTLSYLWVGKSPFSHVLNYLFDFIYIPFIVFVIVKDIPHHRKKIEIVSFTFLVLGSYLVINGLFERFGPHALVWPKYILDPTLGIQFGRTRGSFASSECLGVALIMTFLFYVMALPRVEGKQRIWTWLMIGVTPIVIYTTNQRSVWMGFGVCLIILAILKSHMRRVALGLVCVVMVGFLSGAGSRFSFWENTTLFGRRQNTIDYRKVNMMVNMEMIKANPIYGVGFGNWKTAWPQYFRPIEGVDIPDLSDGNHNTFLGRFAEVGLIGFVVYLLVFYHMTRIGLRVYRKSEGLEREFALVFLCMLISYVIGANFSDYRNSPFFNTTLFLLFGMITGIEAQMAFRTSFDGTDPVDALSPWAALVTPEGEAGGALDEFSDRVHPPHAPLPDATAGHVWDIPYDTATWVTGPWTDAATRTQALSPNSSGAGLDRSS
jgi:O-antigen ligase